MNLIQQKYGEHYIRERFRLYLLRFIEVASEYEKIAFGKTKIYYTSDNIKDKYNIGVGAYFTDEASKRKEINYNLNRIEGWRQTKSYELYTKVKKKKKKKKKKKSKRKEFFFFFLFYFLCI